MEHQEVIQQLKNNDSTKNHDNITTPHSTYQLINVEVAYAAIDRQKIYRVEIAVGSSIAATIIKSGVLDEFPEINLSTQKVGIFSQSRTLQDIVFEGDRIEIYRPLLADPKERRRNNARASDKIKNQEKQKYKVK